jgi:hypothetical protein
MDMDDNCLSIGDKAKILACDNNLWYHSGGGTNVYAYVAPTSYHFDDQATYKSNTGFDANGKWEDPKFVDPANGNFHLQADSPCINAGADVGLTEDLEGNDIW